MQFVMFEEGFGAKRLPDVNVEDDPTTRLLIRAPSATVTLVLNPF